MNPVSSSSALIQYSVSQTAWFRGAFPNHRRPVAPAWRMAAALGKVPAGSLRRPARDD
jgi:hypothetical protein